MPASSEMLNDTTSGRKWGLVHRWAHWAGKCIEERQKSFPDFVKLREYTEAKIDAGKAAFGDKYVE